MNEPASAKPDRVAVVGGGVIGGGWAARFLLEGVDVAVFDPSTDAERALHEGLDNARVARTELGLPDGDEGQLRFGDSIAAVVADADFVQESVPERVELKRAIHREIEAAAPVQAIVGSSTSGITPSVIQAELDHPERLVVGHPFNPVYLLPLVEVVGGKATTADNIARAMAIYESVGMKALHVRKEIDAFIADRLLEAVWRESLWLVNDGVATTEEIDDAIRYGFGLRWAQMGLFETYRIAGGEAGMRHFLSQFGETLSWPWTKLMDVPELTDELADTITAQSDAQSGHMSIRELERMRDKNVAGFLKVLEQNRWGAGETLRVQRGDT